VCIEDMQQAAGKSPRRSGHAVKSSARVQRTPSAKKLHIEVINALTAWMYSLFHTVLLL